MFFDHCSGSIVRHLVAGMKKSKSQSCLEELTVICSSCSDRMITNISIMTDTCG